MQEQKQKVARTVQLPAESAVSRDDGVGGTEDGGDVRYLGRISGNRRAVRGGDTG